jgi:hypothetical protein
MPQTRVRLLTFAAASIAATLAASTSHAQAQAEPSTVREYCLKVAPGKGAEFEAYLRDVGLPLAQARVDAGEFDWSVVTRGVIPAGSSARCDYRVAYGYKGLPPEELSKEGLDAALKRAKLTLTADQLIAKRSALTSLVAAEIWSFIDGIGLDVEKGGYIRFNHYKVGEMDEWVRLETTRWKPLMDAWLKAGGKGGWGVYALAMPGGDSTLYNGMTIDTFPDWNGLVRGVPMNDLWPKVHPNTEATNTFQRLDQARSIHDVEVSKIIEVVRRK